MKKPLVPPFKKIGTSWMDNPTTGEIYAMALADGMALMLYHIAWPFHAIAELWRRSHWKVYKRYK